MKWDIERGKQIKNKKEEKKNSAGNEKLPLSIKYGGNTRRKIIHELYGNLKIPAWTPMIYDTSIIVNHEMCARARSIYDAPIGVIAKLHLPVDAATGHFSNECVLLRYLRFNVLAG